MPSAIGTGTATGLVDLLIGSSAEATLISNLPVAFRLAANAGSSGHYLFPIFIPKGSRLAAAYQNVGTGSSTVEVIVTLFGGHSAGPWANCSYVDRYGATASSRGTNIDPGGSANTYVLAEITSATLRPIRWLVMCSQNTDATFAAATQWTVQLMIGSATEQQIGGDFILTTGTNSDCATQFSSWYLPIFIPTGSRLSVQAKCSSITDGDRDLYFSLFGCG